jgi:hypothetical protein
VILDREQLVAEIVRGVAPHRHADGVELAVDRVVIDGLVAGSLVQARQRAREVGDTGESELIEGDGGHVVLTDSKGHRCCVGQTSNHNDISNTC